MLSDSQSNFRRYHHPNSDEIIDPLQVPERDLHLVTFTVPILDVEADRHSAVRAMSVSSTILMPRSVAVVVAISASVSSRYGCDS